MLAKYSGQVDFGVDEGGGWAQLILPLRLLLFYKVAIGEHSKKIQDYMGIWGGVLNPKTVDTQT